MARLDDLPNLGAFIRGRRKKLELSQVDVANHFGWDRTYIYHLEKSQRTIPLIHIEEFAKILKVKDLTLRKMCAEMEIKSVLEKYDLDRPGSDARFRVEFKKLR